MCRYLPAILTLYDLSANSETQGTPPHLGYPLLSLLWHHRGQKHRAASKPGCPQAPQHALLSSKSDPHQQTRVLTASLWLPGGRRSSTSFCPRGSKSWQDSVGVHIVIQRSWQIMWEWKLADIFIHFGGADFKKRA